MRRNRLTVIFFFFSGLFLLLAFQNCSRMKFNSELGSEKPTADPSVVRVYGPGILMVDHVGEFVVEDSNVDNKVTGVNWSHPDLRTGTSGNTRTVGNRIVVSAWFSQAGAKVVNVNYFINGQAYSGSVNVQVQNVVVDNCSPSVLQICGVGSTDSTHPTMLDISWPDFNYDNVFEGVVPRVLPMGSGSTALPDYQLVHNGITVKLSRKVTNHTFVICRADNNDCASNSYYRHVEYPEAIDGNTGQVVGQDHIQLAMFSGVVYELNKRYKVKLFSGRVAANDPILNGPGISEVEFTVARHPNSPNIIIQPYSISRVGHGSGWSSVVGGENRLSVPQTRLAQLKIELSGQIAGHQPVVPGGFGERMGGFDAVVVPASAPVPAGNRESFFDTFSESDIICARTMVDENNVYHSQSQIAVGQVLTLSCGKDFERNKEYKVYILSRIFRCPEASPQNCQLPTNFGFRFRIE